jgi:SAM-dependent methyltransferase
MDLETPNPDEQRRVAGYFRFVNRWLGATRAVAHHLRSVPRPITVLDVASGAGDLSRELARRLPGIRPIAFDLALWPLLIAGEILRVQGDVKRFPFRDRSVDWTVTTHFFHHLSDAEIVAALKELDRVARRGIVVNDLERSRHALFWIRVLTLFANRFAKADGPQSVRRGFTAPELRDLALRAGLPWLRVRRHFGHRYTLAGERPGENDSGRERG